ncbi:MAG: hypothetical protein IT532_02750 [Burkholderiales bacterium]|nr:hypothetical protein [Burkholderiales bacterium]
MKRIDHIRNVLSAISLVALAASVQAADLETIKVVFDPGVTDRTNMGRPAGEVSELRVGAEAEVMARTNVHREAGDAGAVRISRDAEFMKRTNMGGTAISKQALSTAEAQ